MLNYYLMNTTSHYAIIARWELAKIFKVPEPKAQVPWWHIESPKYEIE